MFLPGLLLGVASCWHKNILKTIMAHPSVVLMPTFTHFTFESSTKWCRGSKQEGEEEQPFIKFSPKFTVVNIILSIAGKVVYGISMTHRAGWDNFDPLRELPEYISFYLCFISIPLLGLLLTLFSLFLISNSSRIHSAIKYTLANLIFSTAAYQVFFFTLIGRSSISWDQNIYFLPVPIFGLLVTILKIILAHFCNFNLPTFTCFSLPRVENGALVCSDPQAHYILDDDGKPERVPEEEEVEEEVDNQNETSADNREADTVTIQEEETVEVVLDH